MNRLIDHTLRAFLSSTYGDGLVRFVSVETDVLKMDAEMSVVQFATAGLNRAAAHLSKPASEMFEDLGAWITRLEPIRRLLRFSGRDFQDFLLRLEELPGRAVLELPALRVPPLLVEAEDHSVWLIMADPEPSWQHFLMGMIRSMADDYGALCVLSVEGSGIRVDICDNQFAEGRRFSLQETMVVGGLQ